MANYSREAIGRRLKSGLVDRGISNEEFAKQIGVSKYTVNEWCSGRAGMTLENAFRVCEALDWPIDRLVMREPA